MRLVARLIVAVIGNAVALFLASRFIAGFELDTSSLWAVGTVALTLTVLNFFVKPVLKLVLGPVIVLTLGIGLIAVNALVLGLLDFLVDELTILTIQALLTSAILIGLVNFIFSLARKD